jgi:hypothetical protein
LLEEGSQLGQPEGIEAAPGFDVHEDIATRDSPAWSRLQDQIAWYDGVGARVVDPGAP